MRKYLVLAFLFTACRSAAPLCNPGHTLLNATLWVHSAAESRAATEQTFSWARRALDDALADPSRTGALEETTNDPSQPPAIIVDVDDTVVKNTPFEARVIRQGKTYDEKTWKEYTAQSVGLAVPGAPEFLTYVKSRGVTVFYITNRDEDERPGTRRNLENLGYPLDPNVETLLLREKVSDKGPRRAQVAAQYRVLLVMGDDLNDFINARDKSWAERDAIITRMKDWWGSRWFLVPNPMYGSWERAAVGTEGTPCEQVERKIRALP